MPGDPEKKYLDDSAATTITSTASATIVSGIQECSIYLVWIAVTVSLQTWRSNTQLQHYGAHHRTGEQSRRGKQVRKAQHHTHIWNTEE